MFAKKGFWYLLMGGSLLGWAFVIIGFVKPYENKTIKKAWMAMAAIWLSHPLEVPTASLAIGRAKGLSLCRVILKTTAYGFTWWLPLKNGVFSR